MLSKFTSLSIITKLLYLLALLLFIVWVIPQMSNYYTNVNKYEQNKQKIDALSLKYGLSSEAQIFTEQAFKTNSELLFSKVDIIHLHDKTYVAHIQMKKDKLDTFHTFLESLSLKYYVQIKDTLEFTTEDEIITIKMTLEAL